MMERNVRPAKSVEYFWLTDVGDAHAAQALKTYYSAKVWVDMERNVGYEDTNK